MAHANANVDANKALDQIAQAWPEFKKTLGIGEAAIWNLSGKTVEVRVYNYIDVVNCIPAMKTLVAEGKVGKVASVVDCLQPYYFHLHLVGSHGSLLDNKFYSAKLDGLNKATLVTAANVGEFLPGDW